MPPTNIPGDDHVVRYVPWARLRKDEDDNVVGVLGAAFRLRDDEQYLSAVWLEYFRDTRDANIVKAVNALRKSNIDVRPRSGFAIGNVQKIKDVCLADQKRYKIRVLHEPEDDNAAHAALRLWPRDNDALLELLAEDTWSELVLNKDVQ